MHRSLLSFLSFLLIASFVVCSSCSLLEKEFPSAVIRLPEPMLTTDGKTIDKLRLLPGTAAILRKIQPIPDNFIDVNPPGSTSPAPVRPGKTVRLGGYFFGGWANGRYMSKEQLDWISQHLDVLSLNPHYVSPDHYLNGGITPEEVLALKRANPQFRFYCMLFATTLREPQFDPATMSSWVIRYKNGKEALGVRRGHDHDVNHLMDLGNQDYAKYFRNFIITHSDEYHADGVAIDEVMWNGYWNVDVADMQGYSSVEQIRQTCYDWLKTIKENNPKEVIHQAFWPDAQQHTDGIWGEGSFYSWFRTGTDYKIFYNTMNYRQIVDNIAEHSRRNETYIWAAYYKQDSREELEYALATYLLGKSGQSVVFHPQPVYDGGYPSNLGGYDISTVIGEYEKHKNLFDVDLGNPVGSLYIEKMGHYEVLVRKYENGIVYCNPNDQ